MKIYRPNIFRDSRGAFFESYPVPEVPDYYIHECYSYSIKGVVRGFHYQKKPYGQEKLITVVKGIIFDVILDIQSGKVESNSLTAGDILFVPKGFAHGFQALTNDVILHYKFSAIYSPQDEAGFSPLDFDWPLPISKISEKDKLWPPYEKK